MSPRDDSTAARAETSGLGVRLVADPPGVISVPASPVARVGIHLGQSVDVACRRGGEYHRGIAVHGDVDVIPAGMSSVWDVRGRDMAVVVSVAHDLLESVAEEYDLDPRRVELRNRFQVRDAQIENVAWALKAELEAGYPSGRLYLDSLAVALATRLVRSHSSAALGSTATAGRMPDRRIRAVLAFIEQNLSSEVTLADLAGVAGVSVTHFKRLFRESAGLPVHQYVIRRRVERARTLLEGTKLPISRIAVEAGFSHQSHLARHMRRVLGVSPNAVRGLR